MMASNGAAAQSFLAIRAIGAEFANRIYMPVLFIGLAAALVLIALVIWLTTMSAWWWLLAIPVVIIISVAIGIAVIVRLIIRYVTPTQTKTQKRAVKEFVSKLQHLSETAHTPKFLLLFRLVRDIAAPRENGYIGGLANDTFSLKKDFSAISKTF